MRPSRRPSTSGLERLEHQARRRRFGVGASLRLICVLSDGAERTENAMLQDISQTGLFVRAEITPEIGQTALLSFRCGGIRCFAAGTVVDVRRARGFAVAVDGASHSFDNLFCELDSVREVVKRDVLAHLRDLELHVA